jgi:hypothetical protein
VPLSPSVRCPRPPDGGFRAESGVSAAVALVDHSPAPSRLGDERLAVVVHGSRVRGACDRAVPMLGESSERGVSVAQLGELWLCGKCAGEYMADSEGKTFSSPTTVVPFPCRCPDSDRPLPGSRPK